MYSLVCPVNESFKHLLIGARCGDWNAQVLLGLFYLYGIFWLEFTSYQEFPIADLVLAAIYGFGFCKVTEDKDKRFNYFHNAKINIFEIQWSL